MRCYFHSQQNCFLDYFNDPVLDGAVIHVGDIPFWYGEKEGMETEVLDIPTGSIFLATSRDHDFLLSHRNTSLHTPTESRKFSYSCIENPSSSTTSHMPLPPSNPSDLLHPSYYNRKRDDQPENIYTQHFCRGTQQQLPPS